MSDMYRIFRDKITEPVAETLQYERAILILDALFDTRSYVQSYYECKIAWIEYKGEKIETRRRDENLKILRESPQNEVHHHYPARIPISDVRPPKKSNVPHFPKRMATPKVQG